MKVREWLMAMLVVIICAAGCILVMTIPEIFGGSADMKLALIAVTAFIVSSLILKFAFLRR